MLLVCVLSVTSVMFAGSAGAASNPEVAWDCQLIRTFGAYGPVVLFDPRAQVSWSGRRLSYTMWSWSSRDTRKSQAGRTYGTITSNSSGWNTSPLDLRHEFITGEEFEYKKVLLRLKDSSGRTGTHTCIWKGPVANGY